MLSRHTNSEPAPPPHSGRRRIGAIAIKAAALTIVLLIHGRCPGAEGGAGVTTTRLVAAGTALDLYLPPSRPAPLVVLSHGFARAAAHHSGTARHLAGCGFAVAVPEVTRPPVLAALVQELARRSAEPGDPLAGRIEARRIGLAGHSAGGAASIEAAVLLQETTTPASALCLLDAVPHRSTLRAAGRLRPVHVASLRAEPSPCNARGSTAALLARLPFSVEDVIVTGATHCDQENPSDRLCALACGAADPERQAVFRDLATRFLEDALLPERRGAGGYRAELARLEARGTVRRPAAEPAAAGATARP
jgi:hypothetical protein